MTLSRTALSPLVLAMTLALAACGEKSPEAQVQAAQAAIKAGDYGTAVIDLKNALQQAPAHAEARLLLGQALLAQGHLDGAEKELRKAQELGMQDGQVLPALARTLVDLGKFKEATELTAPAGMPPQALTTLQSTRASAFLSLGDTASARKIVAESEQGGQKSLDILLIKARLHLAEQQPDKAMALAEEAIALDGKSTDALLLKAEILRAMGGKEAEALKVYERIAAIKPDEAAAHVAIAEMHMQAHRLDAAETALKAAEKAAPNTLSVKFMRAKLEMFRGNLKQSNEALLPILRAVPDHLPSLLVHATVNLGLGNYEQSLKSAQRVLAALPGNLQSAKLVAANLLQMDNAQGALDTVTPLLKTHPDDVQLLVMAGEAHIKLGDHARAEPLLDRAAALQPKNPAIRKDLARTYLALGKTDRGMAALHEAAALSEKVSTADFTLVSLHLSRKEYDKAMQAIAAMEKKAPKDPNPNNLRGLVFLGKGDKAAARKAFEQSLAVQPDFFPAISNLARLDLKENNPGAARKRFEALLEKDKANIQAMLALAELAGTANREEERLDWLNKVVAARPDNIPARSALVQHYLGKQATQKALLAARQAVDASPENPEALTLLGATQLASKDALGAVSTFTRVTEAQPTSAEAWLRLGLAQRVASQPKAARTSLEKAVALRNGLVPALDALIGLNMAENRVEDALRVARALQAAQPDAPAGYDREGSILFAQKRFPQAARAFAQAVARGAGPEGVIKVHHAHLSGGDRKAAEAVLADWMQKYPQDTVVRNFAAEYYTQAGKAREAISLYEALLRADSKHLSAANNLAILYHQEKDPRAVATAEKALAMAPDNPAVQDTLGWILVERGEAARGLPLLEKALAGSKKAASVQYHHAVALAKTGRKAEAKLALQQLLASGARFPEADAARVLLGTL